MCREKKNMRVNKRRGLDAFIYKPLEVVHLECYQRMLQPSCWSTFHHSQQPNHLDCMSPLQ